VPTRAEVTDVANAIYDGTDAIMLSGETSIGLYPVQAVKVMVQVALEAEAALPYDRLVLERAANMTNDIDDAISYSACRIANQIGAALIVAFTESGSTAGRVSKYRPRPPILALTPYKDIQRKLTLRWAVTPVIIEGPKSVDGLFELASQSARELSQIGPGSRLVITAGLPIGVTGGTNLLRVIQLSDSD
jgi:pyruvate kinase